MGWSAVGSTEVKSSEAGRADVRVAVADDLGVGEQVAVLLRAEMRGGKSDQRVVCQGGRGGSLRETERGRT